MLQRMLGSHSQIHTHPEPHLVTPLNYLGYYHTVDKAPYDHINAANAFREFTEDLPNGEEDYLDALRAYAMTLYERVLSSTEKTFFLDKTPEYGTVLPFLAKLFPKAKYVVLTRHPMAILHSQAHSFFEGDFEAANNTNPVVSRYVGAIGQFLTDKPVDMVRVRYEDLVQNPETEMKRVLDHLGFEFEEAVVNYGSKKHITKSYGDPMSVEKHDRPMTKSVSKWAEDMLARPDALQIAKDIAAELDPDHLEAWGYPAESLFEDLEGAEASSTHVESMNAYRLKRKVLLKLRKNIHHNGFGTAVKQVRYYCDVLLRE